MNSGARESERARDGLTRTKGGADNREYRLRVISCRCAGKLRCPLSPRELPRLPPTGASAFGQGLPRSPIAGAGAKPQGFSSSVRYSGARALAFFIRSAIPAVSSFGGGDTRLVNGSPTAIRNSSCPADVHMHNICTVLPEVFLNT